MIKWNLKDYFLPILRNDYDVYNSTCPFSCESNLNMLRQVSCIDSSYTWYSVVHFHETNFTVYKLVSTL